LGIAELSPVKLVHGEFGGAALIAKSYLGSSCRRTRR
jgi:hypothetical protein